MHQTTLIAKNFQYLIHKIVASVNCVVDWKESFTKNTVQLNTMASTDFHHSVKADKKHQTLTILTSQIHPIQAISHDQTSNRVNWDLYNFLPLFLFQTPSPYNLLNHSEQ